MQILLAVATMYGVDIGDSVEIQIAGEEKQMRFTIRGFFEDPFAGSSMMGVKTMLINKASMEELEQNVLMAGEASTVADAEMLHIFQKKDSGQKTKEFIKELNENTDLKNYTYRSYSKTTIEGYMLIAQNIFVGFFLVFVTVLVVVAVVESSRIIPTWVF